MAFIDAAASRRYLLALSKTMIAASANQTTYQNQNSVLTLSFTGTATGGNDRTNG